MLVTITVALAALAVLAAIVVVAVGGGGELSVEHPDHPPLALPGRRSAGGTDAALLRLPMGLWGYHKQITDEALERFAHELTERDTRIAVLEQELAEARQHLYEPPEQSSWRPSVPSASPAPDALTTTHHDFDPADSLVTREGDLPSLPQRVAEPPLPQRADEPPGERAIEPPQTIADKIVFDPAATIADHEQDHEDAGTDHRPGEGGTWRERDE
ncbi:hypothetical protein GCM10023196_061150 [Actinoallomurus vinaceus]|uniref:DivIVA domain-containing protein n=1 Tax=Actinoallomurus vinaceus TaxID=1080074 RepID=A0ABP8UGL4_9ACTN